MEEEKITTIDYGVITIQIDEKTKKAYQYKINSKGETFLREIPEKGFANWENRDIPDNATKIL